MQKQHGRGKHTSLLASLPDAKEAKSHLLKAFVEAGHRLPDPRQEEDFTLHLRLIEAAFFGDRQAGFGLESGSGKAGFVKDTNPEPRVPNPGSLEYRVARVKRLFPQLYQAVWNLAEATWQRLQVYARQGETEAQDLRQKLERAARGTLGHGKKSLKQLWWEGRDRRLAQNPGDAIYQLLWAKFLVALKKAKAERRKAEARKRRAEARKQKQEAKKQEQEARSQEPEDPGLGTGDSGLGEQAERAESKTENLKFKIEEPRNPNPDSEQSSIDNHQSSIPEPRNPNPEPPVPNPGSGQSAIENRQSSILGLQWKVERLIGVFLCSWTYPAFKAAKECNRRVEEAFRGLEGAVEGALQRIDRLRAKREKGRIGKKGKRRKGKRVKGEKGKR